MNSDRERMLTLDFQNPKVVKAPVPLMETGANFLKSMVRKRRTEKENQLLYLGFRNIYHNVSWDDITGTYTHSCTLNMDPSKLGYENTIQYQELIIMKLIDDIRSEIKNLICIYEYGKNGKLHWHLLINTGSTRNIQQLFKRTFGHLGTIVRRIYPNPGETKKQNVERIKEYYKKESHNKEKVFLSYVKKL